MLKIPCSPFSKKRHSGQSHGNRQIIHTSGRMIKMMIVVTHNERRSTKQRLTVACCVQILIYLSNSLLKG